MKAIVHFLGRAKGTVVVILLLLVAQAYCDLALPAYTSDLLDVGLQQGGIEDPVPSSLREKSLQVLTLFVDEADADTLQKSYRPADVSGGGDAGGAAAADAVLTLREDADRETLSSILLVPESILYQMQQSEEGRAAYGQLETAAAAGALTRQDIEGQLAPVISQMENLTDTFLQQMAVGYVSIEYEAQGLDMNAIRNHYLFRIGGKMLAVTLLMSLIAAVVGYLASRVSAGVGRDLRSQLYEKVMSFSSAEIERFSTASLITRCTNDVQQVQTLIVMLLRMVAYAPILAVAGVIKVIQTGSQMSWTIVVAILALAVCIAVLLVVAYPKFKRMQGLVDRLNLVARELLTGVIPIRAFGRQAHEAARFDRANKDLMRTQMFTNRTMNFMMPVMMLIMNGVSVLIVWVGGHGVDEGSVQVGDLTAFITYSMVIITSFLMLSAISIVLPRAAIAASRIQEVLDTPLSLTDPEAPRDAELGGRADAEETGKAGSAAAEAAGISDAAQSDGAGAVRVRPYGAEAANVTKEAYPGGTGAVKAQPDGAATAEGGQPDEADATRSTGKMSRAVDMGEAGTKAAAAGAAKSAAKNEVSAAGADKAGVPDVTSAGAAKVRPDGILAFEDVSFAYPGAGEPVLSHISFTARPGQTTAIIGSTGCGKSTLLSLIPRFYDVTAGRITLDGVDIRELRQETLRDAIGYVPQKSTLFSGTIASNLRYGGADISDADMKEAADIAQATSFILAKEEGFQAPIAQGGSNVSGGQRQRLSIARALAKKPRILLFDDAFSALDASTDAALRRALSQRAAGVTILIVAQRISTILHADQILVMEEGQIVGIGTHTELLRTCQTYREIASGQMSEAEMQRALEGDAAGDMSDNTARCTMRGKPDDDSTSDGPAHAGVDPTGAPARAGIDPAAARKDGRPAARSATCDAPDAAKEGGEA